MDTLTGQHALITGGASGIGLACARALLGAGARVTISGRTAGKLEATAAALGCAWVAMDVAQEVSVQTGFAQVGPVDILVNNAGQAESSPFIKSDAALWQRMLDVNLTGVFHCTQAALPHMLAVQRGRIVNVASTAGLIGYRYVAAYCAAKHGVIGLTRALALEVATKGVTVNAVCPGFTETEIVVASIANIMSKTGLSEAEARSKLSATNPQQRLVQPEEVANAVLWLCLPQSSAMNGQALPVAGGEVM